MDALRTARNRRGISQRELASRAGLSFRGYQLLERPANNSRLGSLERAASALGLPPGGIRRILADFVSLHPDSIRAVSLRILVDGPPSWTVHLFDFVDAFRREPEHDLLEARPEAISRRLDAVLAGTVESLCAEVSQPAPAWCSAVPSLSEPWFVAGVENLKATALAESPLPFRSRNVFVLGNFFERA